MKRLCSLSIILISLFLFTGCALTAAYKNIFTTASSSSIESGSSSQGGIKQKETSQSAPADKEVAVIDDMGDLYTGVLHDYKGGTYSGVLLDGKPHGQGNWTHPNGEYMGEWKDGTIHGQGIFTSYAGRKYIGQWKDGNPWHGNVYDENGVVVAFYLEGARTENQ